MYNKTKCGQPHQREPKRLSKVTKKKTQKTFLRSVLQTEDTCWTEFYRYVERRKGSISNIPAIKDHNNVLQSHYRDCHVM